MEKSYDYFKTHHNRNSFDGDNHKIVSFYSSSSLDGKSSYYDGLDNNFHFFSDVGHPEVSLEIIGHEFTHGVTDFASNLSSANESGALNESFSDIFGAMINYKTLPSYFDYKINAGPYIIRDISNPNDINSSGKRNPDTYNGNYWIQTVSTTTAGIHANSCVQSYWFYLLAEGGNGTNDNGFNYSVQGIGKEKATKIVYRNLCTKITSTSQYVDARMGSIQSAIELYGVCSFEVKQVIYAWDAVGVGVGMFPPNLQSDLAIRDDVSDDFSEPNTGAISNWSNSPDLWVKNPPYNFMPNTHENPISSYTDGNGNIINPIVRTRITNAGCNKIKGNETVSVYWTISRIWNGWPNHWDGRNPAFGNLVGTATIPVLNPGETVVLDINWNTSNMPSLPSGTTRAASLLARIDGGTGDAIQEFPYGQTNNLVLQNNNVCMKNLTIINPNYFDPNSDQNAWQSPNITLQNITGSTRSFDLQFNTDSELLAQSEFYYILPSSLYDQIGNISNHVGVEQHPTIEQAILVTEPLAVLKNIQLSAIDTPSIQPYFNFLTTEVYDNEYEFNVTQSNPESDSLLGSVNFVIRRPYRTYFEANSGDDQRVIEGKSINILAQDIGEDAIYNWYDSEGNLVFTGKSLTLTADESEALKLEVISETDEYKDYDETNIIVTLGLIQSIYPLPAQNNTTFEVEISTSATSASLIIYSTMNTPVNNYIINSTGLSTVNSNLNNLPSGIYKAVLVVNGTISDIKQFTKL